VSSDSFAEYHTKEIFTPGYWAEPSHVAPRLYLGSAPTAVHHQALRNLGVTAIMNCTPDDFGAAAAGFEYYQVPIDDCELVPPETIGAAIKQLETWSEADHVILVHCHAGISRSPSYVIAWWLWRNGANATSDLRTLWSKCLDRLVLVRDIVEPHYKLRQSVLRYFEGVTGG